MPSAERPAPTLQPSRLRPIRILAVALATLLMTLAAPISATSAATLKGSPFAHDSLLSSPDALVPYIVNGRVTSIFEYPWQAYIRVSEGGEQTASCGGAILSYSTVITAAHCVTQPGTTTPVLGGEIVVLVGATEINPTTRQVTPSTHQEELVTNVRIDPLYSPESDHLKDDVALLTVQNSLALSPAIQTSEIHLVAPGATPAAGTAMTVTGYGRETGVEATGNQPDGKLYAAPMTALSSDACRSDVGANSAVLLCAQSTTSATCEGDSGGPLVEGDPAVLVGLVDSGPRECPVNQPDLFTNLAAPEVRDFVEGVSPIAVAARPVSPPTIKSVGNNPVDTSPLTCEPGTWSESPTFSYTFQLENGPGKALQSGTSNVYVPPKAIVGSRLVCIVQANNAGGVSTARSATTAPVAGDTSPPTSSITAPPKCHLNTCTLDISASDPNDGGINLDASASYLIARCFPAGRTKARAAQTPCDKTKTFRMALRRGSRGSYQASISRLPYGQRIAFSVLATDAAGLKQDRPVLASITLHRRHAKSSSRHGKR